MDVKELNLAGCFEIDSYVHTDSRGLFAKFCIDQAYREIGIEQNFAEEFFTVSKRNVVRGMHFQVPPKSQHKTVCCIDGKVLDILFDLRMGSPTYLKSDSIELNGKQPKLIYIPPGIAHGFLAEEDNSILLYKVSEGYSRELDQGIHWNSFGYQWPVEEPITSARDDGLPLLSDFITPFSYEKLKHE
jgi:dTDP-4-dehydrorhamnose 3,5-epimerase